MAVAAVRAPLSRARNQAPARERAAVAGRPLRDPARQARPMDAGRPRPVRRSSDATTAPPGRIIAGLAAPTEASRKDLINGHGTPDTGHRTPDTGSERSRLRGGERGEERGGAGADTVHTGMVHTACRRCEARRGRRGSSIPLPSAGVQASVASETPCRCCRRVRSSPMRPSLPNRMKFRCGRSSLMRSSPIGRRGRGHRRCGPHRRGRLADWSSAVWSSRGHRDPMDMRRDPIRGTLRMCTWA